MALGAHEDGLVVRFMAVAANGHAVLGEIMGIPGSVFGELRQIAER